MRKGNGFPGDEKHNVVSLVLEKLEELIQSNSKSNKMLQDWEWEWENESPIPEDKAQLREQEWRNLKREQDRLREEINKLIRREEINKFIRLVALSNDLRAVLAALDYLATSYIGHEKWQEVRAREIERLTGVRDRFLEELRHINSTVEDFT